MRIKQLILAAAVSFLPAASAFSVEVGDVVPGINLLSVGSAKGSLSNSGFNGKVTMINFWATWCAACKTELLEMEAQLKPYLKQDKIGRAHV